MAFCGERSLSGLAQNGFDTVSQSVVPEIRNAKDALCSVESVQGKDLELGNLSDANCGKECSGQNQSSHVFQSLIGQNPDVLNVIALFDEPDGLLNAPAGEISLNHPPQDLSVAAHGFGGKQHQRLLSESFGHYQPQLLLRMLRQTHRTKSKLDEVSLFTAALLPYDRLCVRSLALLGQFKSLSQFSTIKQMPVSPLTDNETNRAVILEQMLIERP